jgi:hypothetical protein
MHLFAASRQIPEHALNSANRSVNYPHPRRDFKAPSAESTGVQTMAKIPNLLRAVFLFTALFLATTADAGSPFSSNVVELTARNWRKEVEESPHAVFVNVSSTFDISMTAQ